MYNALDTLKTGTMDFKGQQTAYTVQLTLTTIGAIVGLLYGFIKQSFWETLKVFLYCTGIGLVFSALPWPWYRRNLITWTPIPEESDDDD